MSTAVDLFLNQDRKVTLYGVPLFPGLTVVLATAGLGKTRLVSDFAESEPTLDDAHLMWLSYGEPYSTVQHDFKKLLGLIKKAADSSLADLQNGAGSTVLVIDSLMALWSEQWVVEGRAFASKGVPWGVPVFLGAIQAFAESHGLVIIATLNPSLANVSDVENAISGQVGTFFALNTCTAVSRVLVKGPLSLTGRPYRRLRYAYQPIDSADYEYKSSSLLTEVVTTSGSESTWRSGVAMMEWDGED